MTKKQDRAEILAEVAWPRDRVYEQRSLRDIETLALALGASGLTQRVIGEIIGRSASGVKALLGKAFRKLRGPNYKAERKRLAAILAMFEGEDDE